VFKQVSWLPGLPTFCAFPESRLISLNRLKGFPVAYSRFRNRLQLRGSSRLLRDSLNIWTIYNI